MIHLFDQKRELGLIPYLAKSENKNAVTKFDDEIQLAFLIANYDPASELFIKEMELLESLEVNFIVSKIYGIWNLPSVRL